MKNLKYLYFLILTLLSLAACSKDSFNAPSDPADEPTNPQEKIYLSLGLSNEIAIDSRAYADDYVETENQIVNGKVFVYDAIGETESEALCVASGILVKEGDTLTPSQNESGNEFSTKPIKFKNVELTSFDFDETHNYYALVILNANENFEFPSTSGNQTFGTWALKPQSNKMVINVKENSDWEKYITMTNATGHIGWKEEEEFKPANLVPIKREDLKKGKFDEDHSPSTTIYVQRNTAKVVVKPNDKITGEDKLFTVGPFTLQLNIANWKLHLVNNTSYPVMNIQGLTWEKSYSTSGSLTFNRVYWCKDPNYNELSTDLKSNFTGAPLQVAAGDPLYPLENTFSTDCMLQGQTTRAIIRCKIDPNPYKQNNNTERWDKYKLPKNYDNNNNNLDIGVFKIGEGNEETLWDKQHIEETLTIEFKKHYGDDQNPEINWKIPFKDWTGNDGGIKSLSEILSIKIGEEEISGEKLDLLAKSLKLTNATSPEITFYEYGWCYYVVRIRHYNENEAKDGEESVAWDESMSKVNNGKSVADYQSRHLGRYGIVRNNYYVITVNTLHKLGSPYMIPEINNDDTDDMPNDYFIDVTVNVKKWGLRETSFDF